MKEWKLDEMYIKRWIKQNMLDEKKLIANVIMNTEQHRTCIISYCTLKDINEEIRAHMGLSRA